MNSPLMDVTTPCTQTECDALVEELIRLFNDETVRAEALHADVYRAKQLARACQSARLNLAISVGIELVFPAHTLNGTYAGSYRKDARECNDYCPEMELWFEELLLRALAERLSRSTAAVCHQLRAKYQIAFMCTERDLEALREAAVERLRHAAPPHHMAG
jgi:hypothetical protein